MINGVSRKEGDQDTLEEVLTISNEEMIFWNKIDKNPDEFLKELGILDTV